MTAPQAKALKRLWVEHPDYGTQSRFAVALAATISGKENPSPADVEAANARLKRLINRTGSYTDESAHWIKTALKISRIELDKAVFEGVMPQTQQANEGGIRSATPYQHLQLVHEYLIGDPDGHVTHVKTSERVRLLRKKTVAGSYWSAPPQNLHTGFSYEEQLETAWKRAIAVETSRVRKMGSTFRWDTHHEPALLEGEKVWFLTSFDLVDEFRESSCSDDYHSQQMLGSFTWRIKFPEARPAKRWWVTVEYSDEMESNTTLESQNEPTLEILWRRSDLKKGEIYFMNWEW